MLANEFLVACKHAAEVLRPGPIYRTVDDHAAYLPCAHFLGFRREAEERVDLALREELLWCDGLIRQPVDVLNGVKPHMRRHGREKDVRGSAQSLHSHTLSLEIRDAADAFIAK